MSRDDKGLTLASWGPLFDRHSERHFILTFHIFIKNYRSRKWCELLIFFSFAQLKLGRVIMEQAVEAVSLEARNLAVSVLDGMTKRLCTSWLFVVRSRCHGAKDDPQRARLINTKADKLADMCHNRDWERLWNWSHHRRAQAVGYIFDAARYYWRHNKETNEKTLHAENEQKCRTCVRLQLWTQLQ